MLRAAFLALTLLFAGNVLAQASPRAPTAAQSPGGPSWKSLTPAQRDALAPLAGEWGKWDAVRKQKWLEVAARFDQLSPEGKKHVHERMTEIARLTPEQRRTMRENFRRTYELPAEQRELRVQTYQQLSEERKQELAAKARQQQATKPEPPRKPTREIKVDAAIPVGN